MMLLAILAVINSAVTALFLGSAPQTTVVMLLSQISSANRSCDQSESC